MHLRAMEEPTGQPWSRLAGRILALALPVVAGSLSQTLMGLIDTLMVGRLGTEALAAVGVATLLFSAVAMSLKALDTAVQTFAARRVGQGREDEVGQVLATGLAVVLTVGLVLGCVGLFWPDLLLRLVSGDADVRRLGADYLFWRYAGLLPFLFFCIFRGAFDGIGRTRVGMTVGIGMNLANVGLNYVLIFGKAGLPALGVQGAAVASSIASLLAAAAILVYAARPSVRRRFGMLRRHNLAPDLLGPLLRIGWPPVLQTLANLTGVLIFFFILGRISTLAVAAGNIVLRIASLSFMPGFGVGVAVQTLVGQALGRRDPGGAVRAAWGGVAVAVILMGLFGVVFVLWPGRTMSLFARDPVLIEAGKPVLRLMGLVQVIDAVGLSLAGALRGGGATRSVMWVDIAFGFCLLPPCTWLFGVAWGGGLLGAWWAILLWFSAFAVGMVWLFLRGNWKRIEL